MGFIRSALSVILKLFKGKISIKRTRSFTSLLSTKKKHATPAPNVTKKTLRTLKKLKVIWPVDPPFLTSASYKDWGEHWNYFFDEKNRIWRRGKNSEGLSQHRGYDAARPVGTHVRAILPGSIQLIRFDTQKNGGFGLYIRQEVLVQGEKYRIYYAHLSKTVAKKDERVMQGQLIARTGNSGNSTGPHLHLEAREGLEGKQSVEMEFI